MQYPYMTMALTRILQLEQLITTDLLQTSLKICWLNKMSVQAVCSNGHSLSKTQLLPCWYTAKLSDLLLNTCRFLRFLQKHTYVTAAIYWTNTQPFLLPLYSLLKKFEIWTPGVLGWGKTGMRKIVHYGRDVKIRCSLAKRKLIK